MFTTIVEECDIIINAPLLACEVFFHVVFADEPDVDLLRSKQIHQVFLGGIGDDLVYVPAALELSPALVHSLCWLIL